MTVDVSGWLCGSRYKHTWNKEGRPADNYEVVLPSDIVEAHRRGLEQNESS